MAKLSKDNQIKLLNNFLLKKNPDGSHSEDSEGAIRFLLHNNLCNKTQAKRAVKLLNASLTAKYKPEFRAREISFFKLFGIEWNHFTQTYQTEDDYNEDLAQRGWR